MIVFVIILSAWDIVEPAGEPFQDRSEIFSSTCRLYSREVAERYYTLTARVRQLLESLFETRNFSNGQISHFSITYGIQDSINGISVRIVYRPRWWFEAEMLLDGDTAASQVAKGGEPWESGAN